MKKALLDYQAAYIIILVLLVGSSIFGIMLIKDYTGYAVVESEAGTITEIIIDDRRSTVYWAGVFGLVFSQSGFDEDQTATLTQGSISSATFVFPCQDPSKPVNEMYAIMNSSFNFSDVRAGTTDMIDVDFLNLTNDTKERANNTFIYNESVLLGSTNISAIPSAYTYVNDVPGIVFSTGILNASGKFAFVIRVYATSQTSFKGTQVDYQALLPVKNTSTWYFFNDPNDECPAGFGSGQIGDAIIAGFVFESGGTTPIINATVSAGGSVTETNSTGGYNITVPGDRVHNLVVTKDGYITNITAVNTTIGATSYQNLTMTKFFGYVGANATISGHVKDSSNGSIISSAQISVLGLITYSNSTGNYSLVVPAGTNLLAAIKSGYNNFVGNFTINASQNLSFIINMTSSGANESEGNSLSNGTVQGFVRDSSTGSALSGVTVTVAGSSNITNSLGFYNLSALSGTTNLVATLSGYESYAAEINVTANSIAILNFSMTPTKSGSSNGTIAGRVTTTSGSSLSDVRVSIAGRSNLSTSSGIYNISSIPAGTHNLVATKSGYENYFTEVNISANNITSYNFEMETTSEAGLGAGSGVGQGEGSGSGLGAGRGPGRGSGTGVPAQLQQPTQVVEYELSVKRIIKKLTVGTFVTVPIGLYNYKEDSIDVRFSLEGAIVDLARIDKERALIDGNSNTEITLTFLGNVEPGIYEGYFVVSGSINEKIPVYILVLERERLSIESLVIKITPVVRKLPAGDTFRYTVDLQNMLSEEKYKVALSYYVNGINTNRSTFIEKEEIVIQTSFSLLKKFDIPKEWEIGDYQLTVKADFLEKSTQQSTIFTVVIPFYKYKILGLVPVYAFMIALGSIGTCALLWIWFKKKQAAKKRYNIELDPSTLPKPGPRSASVGFIAETKTRTYFDLDLFQVHTVVAGSSGSGKSLVTQVLAEEALFKNVAVVVFDPTAQWTGFLRRLDDKKLLSIYPNFGLKRTDARAFNGNVHQVVDGRQLIDFNKSFKPGEVNVFVINKLETRDIELFVANAIKEIFHAHLPESKELKYLLVYDGIHSLLPKFGGTGSVFVQIERATREFRKWGVGLILVSQVLSDFPPEVMANINTEVALRTRDEGDLNRAKEKYGDKILQSMVKAGVGTGVVQNSNYNKGKPYFVAFRPVLHGIARISDEELDNYNKYNDMIEDIEYQLEQLEKEGIDVFDLKLELKLSQDKVKSGNFNMVAIYLDGLAPRIKSQWEKIGKAPKKRVIKYYKEGELEGELEQAKKKKKAEGEKEQEEVSTEEPPSKHEELSASEKQMLELYSKIRELININKKQEASTLYSQVQQVYRDTPKEEKVKVLERVTDIQKLLKINSNKK